MASVEIKIVGIVGDCSGGAGVETCVTVAAILVAHPKLMQRPIAVKGDRALIARPLDRVLELALEAD